MYDYPLTSPPVWHTSLQLLPSYHNHPPHLFNTAVYARGYVGNMWGILEPVSGSVSPTPLVTMADLNTARTLKQCQALMERPGDKQWRKFFWHACAVAKDHELIPKGASQLTNVAKINMCTTLSQVSVITP